MGIATSTGFIPQRQLTTTSMKEDDAAGKTGRKTSDADKNQAEARNEEGEEKKGDDQTSAILP